MFVYMCVCVCVCFVLLWPAVSLPLVRRSLALFLPQGVPGEPGIPGRDGYDGEKVRLCVCVYVCAYIDVVLVTSLT